ncbi:MAG: hypothetical protein J1E95_11530 [Muribaculaceae bacterium]|nr:hypothetical protein [Muribaculaceae bacterium]
MKKLLIFLLLALFGLPSKAENISSVETNGSWIYLWDSEGKKYKTFSKSTIGDIIGVAGDTFTSKNGSWIYTWDKNGKKINTRSAH